MECGALTPYTLYVFMEVDVFYLTMSSIANIV
jgi:hypothetical protein